MLHHPTRDGMVKISWRLGTVMQMTVQSDRLLESGYPVQGYSTAVRLAWRLSAIRCFVATSEPASLHEYLMNTSDVDAIRRCADSQTSDFGRNGTCSWPRISL